MLYPPQRKVPEKAKRMQPYIIMIWNYFQKGINDKLNILTQIQSRIETMEKEEARIREDIRKMILESNIEHGNLSQRLK